MAGWQNRTTLNNLMVSAKAVWPVAPSFCLYFLRKEELSNKSQLALLQPLHALVRPNLHATTPTLMEETRVYQVYWHFGNMSCRGQKIPLKDLDFRTGYKKTWDRRGTLCNFNPVGMILIFGPFVELASHPGVHPASPWCSWDRLQHPLRDLAREGGC